MASPNYGMSTNDLKISVQNLCRLIGVMKQVDIRIGDFTPSLEKFLNGNHDLVLDLPRTEIAIEQRFAGETVISIPGGRRFTADFYRNSSTHLFLPTSLLALSELVEGEISTKHFEHFRNTFEKEYLLPSSDVFESHMEAVLSHLEEDGLIKETRGKLKFTTRDIGLFNPGLILGSIQAVLYAYKSLKGRTQHANDWPISNLVKELHDEFKSAVYLAKFQRTESSAKSSIESALTSLRQLGIVIIKEDEDFGKVASFVEVESEEIDFLKLANKSITNFLHNLGSIDG